jgi:hypothetical protein
MENSRFFVGREIVGIKKIVFMGLKCFLSEEIEVFEIAD